MTLYMLRREITWNDCDEGHWNILGIFSTREKARAHWGEIGHFEIVEFVLDKDIK